MKGRCTAVVVLLAGIACLSSAPGETLSVAPSDVAMITGNVRDRNVARMVINVDIPDRVLNARIDFARLEFPSFLSDSSPRPVTVVAHTSQRAWKREGVSWTKPWIRQGGDFDSLSRAYFTALPGDKQTVVLNITQPVRDWKHGKGKCGLFLKRPDTEGGGFLGERERLRAALRSARVMFYFTPIQK